jgi:hypothetical protein
MAMCYLKLATGSKKEVSIFFLFARPTIDAKPCLG